jgi:hypothetical protein
VSEVQVEAARSVHEAIAAYMHAMLSDDTVIVYPPFMEPETSTFSSQFSA